MDWKENNNTHNCAHYTTATTTPSLHTVTHNTPAKHQRASTVKRQMSHYCYRDALLLLTLTFVGIVFPHHFVQCHRSSAYANLAKNKGKRTNRELPVDEIVNTKSSNVRDGHRGGAAYSRVKGRQPTPTRKASEVPTLTGDQTILFDRLDTDKDGFVSVLEFTASWHDAPFELWEQDDANNDGRISLEEVP